MGIVAGITAFLQVLPKILDLMSKLGNVMSSAQFQGWLDKLEKDIDGLENAKESKDKYEAARNLIKDIRGL